MIHSRRLCAAPPLVVLSTSAHRRRAENGTFLYVAEPGIRNYVEYGGVGVIVYDMDERSQVRQAHSDVP